MEKKTQSGSLENQTTASIVYILESSLGFTVASPTVAKLVRARMPCHVVLARIQVAPPIFPCATRQPVHA